MRKSILVLLLFAVALPFQAQAPYLVRDINTTYSFETRSSSPKRFTSYRGRTYFVASAEPSGPELWSTGDNGTSLVADLVPGQYGSDPEGLIVVNDVLLFSVRDVDHGLELWASDGTAAGSRMLLDINPGPSSSTPFASTVYGNRMLFSADDGIHGRELWVTDGTAGGTRMILDINPGAASSSPGNFVAFNNSLYFSAAGGFWKTDGTVSGTVKVAAMFARLLAVAGGQLFFEGLDVSNGPTNWEPWVSDGTAGGTRMVADIIPGSKGSQAWSQYPSSGFTPLGNKVLFLADDGVHGRELWISDGTSAGTRMVRDFVPGVKGMWDQGYLFMGAFGNRAWFAARDAEHGEELWVTDGTEGGTALFLDLVPGTESSEPAGFTVSNGKLFFAARSSPSLYTRLWVTDGSAAGTRVVGGAAAPGISPRTITPIGGKVYFSGLSDLYGAEPWISDGTDAGTRQIFNVASDVAPSSKPFMLTATSDLLFFYANEDRRRSLWRSDGTANGTFKLREGTDDTDDLEAAGPLLFFSERVGNQEHALVSDGTIEGTKPVDDFMTRFGDRKIKTFFPFGDTLFASVTPPDRDEPVLWKTTAALNAAAEDLGARDPASMIEVAGHYAFYARGLDGLFGRALWMTDGTRAGTYAVVPDLKADRDHLSRLVNLAGTIFFVKQERDQNPKLWKSDGTMDGTTVVREVPGISTYQPRMGVAGRRVFLGTSSTLWASDGTESGTTEIDIPEMVGFPDNITFATAGDRVLFQARNDTYGYDLWSSDGTQSGTFRVGDGVSELVSIEGRAYFAGLDAQHGTELWTSDGTPEGTRLLIDLNPGPGSSSPAGFAKVGNAIYFSAHTNATGRELWALPLTEPRLSIGDARALEGDAASTVVRFTVSLAAAEEAVAVNYATANGTAIAGQDYETAAGRLTFLPGETTKFIEVRVLADSSAENNEMFAVVLSNPSGASVLKGEATGIIDDEDQAADVSVTPSFTTDGPDLYDSVSVSNLGPRSATEIALRVTLTPAHVSQRCTTCLIPQLAAGESKGTAGDFSSTSRQIYLSAIATARQDDPQTSNNSASWTVNLIRTMAMSPGWLTTGATGTITAMSNVPTPSVTSSDPSVVTASAVTQLSPYAVTFTVTALKPGTSTIYLDGQQKSIVVTVVAPGLAPRWPGAVKVSTDFTARRFDQPVTITITPAGVAPLTAATATGTFIVSAAGQELARRTIAGTSPIAISLYLPSLLLNNLQLTYSGDANFLPETFESPVFVHKGNVSLTGTLVRVPGAAGTYALTMEAAGSPAAAPTGTVAVLDGTTEVARISLQPSGAGTSRAEVTLTNLPKSSTLTLNYQGDAFYQSGSQQIRTAEARRRSVRH